MSNHSKLMGITHKSHKRYDRLSYDHLSPTVITFDFNGRDKLHPKSTRGLSLREGARLQTISDGFEFIGNFNQIGNMIGKGLPSMLTSAVFSHVKKLVEGKSVHSISNVFHSHTVIIDKKYLSCPEFDHFRTKDCSEDENCMFCYQEMKEEHKNGNCDGSKYCYFCEQEKSQN